MLRSLFAAAAFLLVTFALQASALAGSYLTRAAILLEETRREGDALQPRTHDKELVAIIKALAETRAKLARKMEVPVAVAKAHPHLLLVLEHGERAADAAEKGNFKRFMEHLNAARDEDKIFRAVLAELKQTLPDPTKK